MVKLRISSVTLDLCVSSGPINSEFKVRWAILALKGQHECYGLDRNGHLLFSNLVEKNYSRRGLPPPVTNLEVDGYYRKLPGILHSITVNGHRQSEQLIQKDQ